MTPDELRSLADEATPGPWRFTQEDGLIRDAEDYHIVSVAGSPRHTQLAASARLIALAPDLARLCAELGEALEAILEHNPPEVVKDDFAYDRLQEAYRDCARAALAKLSELKT